MSSLVTPRIEMAFGQLSYAFNQGGFDNGAFGAESGWTNVTPDVVLREGETVKAVRGIKDNQPGSRVAGTGTMEFYLDNSTHNTGKIQGWYSPARSVCRSGFGFGIPVRLVLKFNGTDHTAFVGKLRSILPDPGKYLTQRTYCLAQDCMGDLIETDVRSIPPQINQTEAQLIQAVIAALPSTAQPIATSIDAGLDTYPYAFDNISGGVKAASACADVMISSLGKLYGKADGTLKYENRHNTALRTSQFDVTELMDRLVMPSDLSNVYNRVRVTAHKRVINSVGVVYSTPQRVVVDAGTTVTIWASYLDPSNALQLIGATGFQLTAPTNSYTGTLPATDWTATANSDGTGTDLSANVAITATCFASDAQFKITNAGGVSAWVQLQLRAQGIYDKAPVTLESYTQMAYGDRPLDIDLTYQGDTNIAQDFGDYLDAQYRSFAAQANDVEFNASQDDTVMGQALTRDIGDVVTLYETMTTDGMEVCLQLVEINIAAGGSMRCRWGLAPFAGNGVGIFDDAVQGLFDSTLQFGYA